MRFVFAQIRRLSTGAAIGGVIAALARIGMAIGTAAELAPANQIKSAAASVIVQFHIRAALYVIGFGLLAVVFIPAIAHVLRFLRAWWAGITTLTTIISAGITAGTLLYGVEHPKTDAVFVGSILLVLLAGEYWRSEVATHAREFRQPLDLNIPARPTVQRIGGELQWDFRGTDDPIENWDQDIIGRAAVVELLAEHALRIRTPIIALQGDFGDGKTSVLNLLHETIRGKAIVVPFSAWLPGSEVTLATDLFADIATECRRHLHVPQLRRRAIAYARTVSGSFSYLAGLKEVLPPPSQRQEIEELRESLARIPLPVVVLLDDIDRMQKDEILVLLKILRGAASMPNVTFICALSDREVRRQLGKTQEISDDYLEKFFPVTIQLPGAQPDVLGILFRDKLIRALDDDNWFATEDEKSKFSDLLSQLWNDSLSRVCTNLRRIGLLLNDIFAISRSLAGEVNAFDFVTIEAVRRFYPEVHRKIRGNPLYLTYATSKWSKGFFLGDEERKRRSNAFFDDLNATIANAGETRAIEAMLSWIFPDYAATHAQGTSIYTLSRPTNTDIAARERRICDPDYFGIYFRAAIPEEMFSNAELREMLNGLGNARTESQVNSIYDRTLNRIPKQHPKRDDFLWKLGHAMGHLDPVVCEHLAYAASCHAADYAYDLMNIGEAAKGLNIVFIAAQKLSNSSAAQRVLDGAMSRATDDTFAIRLLEYTRNRNQNKILTNFSNVDLDEVRTAFVRRMRRRYGADADIQQIDLSTADWHAFRTWAENSAQDKQIEQEFWRKFIGQSRQRLAQALNFLYPGHAYWDEDPRPIIEKFFPMDELAHLVRELPNDASLDEVDYGGITRFEALLQGNYQRIG